MKKVFSLIMILIISITLAACSQTNSTSPTAAPTSQSATSDGKLFPQTTELSLLTPLIDSWPIQDDWKVLGYIQDATNVKLKVVKQVGEIADVLPPMLASGTAPDLLELSIGNALPAITENALVNFKDYKDTMLDFFNWINDNKEITSPFLSPDGQMYMAPQTDIGEANRQGWLYRKDIFNANNIKLPTNETEFYNVLKKLKKLYPDSTPFVFRNGLTSELTKIDMMASQWNASSKYYLDRSTDTWKYGVIEDNFKEFVTFMHKLFMEKLIPQDFLSIDANSWQERISSSQGFVTFDYLTRIDGFNTAMRGSDPKFTLCYMDPWKGGANGTNKLQFTATNDSFLGVYSKSKNIDNAVKYINWLYTDEAEKLLSWGVEGDTYKVENGQNKFVGFKDITDLRAKTGLSTLGMYGRFDYQSHMSLFSPELLYAYQSSQKADQTPLGSVSFTGAENDVIADVGMAIQKYQEEQIAKFITNERPLSQWNAFVSEIKALGVDQMLKLYNTAYARQKKN